MFNTTTWIIIGGIAAAVVVGLLIIFRKDICPMVEIPLICAIESVNQPMIADLPTERGPPTFPMTTLSPSQGPVPRMPLQSPMTLSEYERIPQNNPGSPLITARSPFSPTQPPPYENMYQEVPY